jgi:xanthine dehydrogenase accessory factor
MKLLTLIRGGGDLASGVALRLHRAGLKVLITELPQPTTVRRFVSFSEAIYRGEFSIEGVVARLVNDLPQALACMVDGVIPVMVDKQIKTLEQIHVEYREIIPILVDARMIKSPPEYGKGVARLVIGLGPGFTAGEHCHAVVETKRGHRLGRVIWEGSAEADTGIPEGIAGRATERVIRAPVDGVLEARVEIGDHLDPGEPIAWIGEETITAPFAGVLRGLIHPGLAVKKGLKIGDLDPRDDPSYCYLVSDKSLAAGGEVLGRSYRCQN